MKTMLVTSHRPGMQNQLHVRPNPAHLPIPFGSATAPDPAETAPKDDGPQRLTWKQHLLLWGGAFAFLIGGLSIFPDTRKMLHEGIVKPLLTKRTQLKDYDEAFDLVKSGKIKEVIYLDFRNSKYAYDGQYNNGFTLIPKDSQYQYYELAGRSFTKDRAFYQRLKDLFMQQAKANGNVPTFRISLTTDRPSDHQ